jgi:hypothetical protein
MQPCTKFLFNANGAVSQRERKFAGGTTQILDFFWDGQDRLRTVKQGGLDFFTAEYNGDGLGVKNSDTRAGLLTPHVFSWSPMGVLHDSHQDTRFTPGWGQREGGSMGVDRFFHSDWLGSTRYLSDSTGDNFPSELLYDAYGNGETPPLGPDHPTDYLFAGQWGYQTEYQTGSEPGLGLQYLEQRCDGNGDQSTAAAMLSLSSFPSKTA